MTAYTTLKLPKDLVEQIDELLNRKSLGYTSRTEVVKDAVRAYLARIKRIEDQP